MNLVIEVKEEDNMFGDINILKDIHIKNFDEHQLNGNLMPFATERN